MNKISAAIRAEDRFPMEVAVRISPESTLTNSEQTFTENVSRRGARILTRRRWLAGDRVWISLLPSASPADNSACARVAYCHSLDRDSFAVGLQFLESAGPWSLGLAGGLGAIL